MSEKIVMPKLGMVMSEGAISKFLKDKGDAVSQGEVIAQIETEKNQLRFRSDDHRSFSPGSRDWTNGSGRWSDWIHIG